MTGLLGAAGRRYFLAIPREVTLKPGDEAVDPLDGLADFLAIPREVTLKLDSAA